MSRKYADRFLELIGSEEAEEAAAVPETVEAPAPASTSVEMPPAETAEAPALATPDKAPQDDAPAYKTPTANTAGRALREVFSERDRLASELSSGRGRVVEMDPALIDPSPFADRLPDDDDADYQALRQSILEAGQAVPVEIRSHPDNSERYQTVFGHRRIRAAQDLGIKVKAIISDVDDRGHLTRQASENAARQDLSWAEKALFVQQMDANAFPTGDIANAMGVDRSRVSELRATAKAIPTEIIRAIGRAPKAGRPKWKSLEAAYTSNTEVSGRALEILGDATSRGLSSDDRFQLLFSALQSKAAGPDKIISPTEIGKAITSAVGEDDRAGFTDYIRRELPSLVKKFYAARRDD